MYCRGPCTTANPHLFVIRNTAVDDAGPPISAGVVHKPFKGLGLSDLAATRYVLSAHPDKKNGPIAP
ncbi:hypothetical protein ACWD25_30265 [Streptomyces sp. NPDC002920]